jgi:hypothetical protein
MSKEGLEGKDKMWVRFPNESFYDEVYNFNIKDFNMEKKFYDEVFGYWLGGYIVIKREDYDRLSKK